MSEVRYCGTGGALVKPDDPSNESILSAVPAFGGIDVSWTYPGINPEALAHTILYRNTADDFASASIHARVSGSFFFDSSKEETPIRYYYWIKHLSINGTLFPEIGPATAIARLPIAQVIEGLTSQIDNGFLALSLRSQIESISTIRQGLEDEIAARMEELALISEMFEGIRQHSEESRILLNGERDKRREELAIILDELRITYGELRNSVTTEQERLAIVEGNLLGPDHIDGTVANRIKQEREERIESLGIETDNRVLSAEFEANARVEAIQAEAKARGEQIFDVKTQIELEKGFYAAKLDVVAAAYQANAATTYSLEEVRVTDLEAMAKRVNGVKTVVDDNEAEIIKEIKARSDAQSAMASEISIISAKLNALPTFANGFEYGVEFDRWVVTGNHSITNSSGDVFSGSGAALVGSTETEASINTSTIPFAVSVMLGQGTGEAFAGRALRLGIASKAVAGGSAEFAIGYATSDGWFSGWERLVPGSVWSIQEVFINVPDTVGLEHYIVLWGDTSGSGGTVLVDRLLVEVSNSDVPEITAQITEVKEAFVNSEKAFAENVESLTTVYDTQIANITLAQETLSTEYLATAKAVETLTVTTGDVVADIQYEKLVRAEQTEALAQDVTDLWVGVGVTEGRITRESEVRAEADYFRGLIQDVMQANVETSSATFSSIKEIVIDKDEIMARNVNGISGEVGNVKGSVSDIMQMNIDPTSVLATRFSGIEGTVGEHVTSIETIENLVVGEESVIASRMRTIETDIGIAKGNITDLDTLNLSEDSALLLRFEGMDTRFGTTEATIESIQSLQADTDRFQGFVSDVISASIESTSAAYSAMTEVIIENETVSANDLKELAGKVGTAEGTITNLDTLLVTGENAVITRLESAEITIGTSEGLIEDIIFMEVGEDTALFQKFKTIEGSVGSTNGRVDDILELKIDENEVLFKRFTDVEGEVEDARGLINDAVDLSVRSDEVLINRISEIEGNVNETSGRISNIETLQIDSDSVLASTLKSIEGQVAKTSGQIRDIQYLNLSPDSALITTLDQVQVEIEKASADIKNIAHLELTDEGVIAQQFNTIDAAFENMSLQYKNIVTMNLDKTEGIGLRFEELANAEKSVYDIMELNEDSVAGTQLYQRLIGIENETSRVQLRAASYSGAIVQNGSFSGGEMFGWTGWESISVVERNDESNITAVKTMPSRYAAVFPDVGHGGSQTLTSSSSPITGGEDYTFRISIAGGGNVNLNVEVVVRWYSLGGFLGAEKVLEMHQGNGVWNTSALARAKAPAFATEAFIAIRRLAGGSGLLYVTDVRANIVGEALGSLFTAKVEENGLVGGFGIYNNGDFVEAGFDVERFWVGRTGTNEEGYKVKPFIIENNEVFMDEAVINKLTFDKLRAADGSLIVENGKVKGDFIEAKDLVVKESATFTGVAQSKDFVSGSPGWKLDPINNTGEINFPISFSNVSGAGGLAGKDSVDYETDVANRPEINIKRAVVNAYNGNDLPSAYVTNGDTVGQLMFEISNNNTWPESFGGVVTYWYSDNRATQVCFNTGDGKENVRYTRPGYDPDNIGEQTWTPWQKKEVFTSADVNILDTDGAGLLAAMDNVDMTDVNQVRNAGALATKNSVDYDADVENRPFVRLGTNAYSAGNWANYYDLEHKVGELIFTVSGAAGWPTTGGVITYWYASDRATQVCFATGSGDEWVRRTNPTLYPYWSSWTRKEVFSSADVNALDTFNGPSEAGATSNSIYYQLTAPSGVKDGDIWAKPDGSSFVRKNNAWRESGDKTANNTAADTTLVAGMDALTIRASTENNLFDPSFVRTVVDNEGFWTSEPDVSYIDHPTWGVSALFDVDNNAVRTIYPTNINQGARQKIPLSSGQTVGIGFSGRFGDRQFGSDAAFFRAGIEFFTASGTPIGIEYLSYWPDTSSYMNSALNPDGPIVRGFVSEYSGNVVAPNGSSYGIVRFQVRNCYFHLMSINVDITSASRTWTRPNSTLIDGNKIYTGDAYVDTLQIKGNAVTIPQSSYTAGTKVLGRLGGGDPDITDYTTWKNVQTLYLSEAPGKTQVICSFRLVVDIHGMLPIFARVIDNGSVVYQTEVARVPNTDRFNYTREAISFVLERPPTSGSRNLELEVRSGIYTGTGMQFQVSHRMISATTMMR